ncbi:DUF2065 domain-containing protein [Vibrio viridaestus]|uniref:DUF2065 domain-containing protein n=1 Tax=Vibrio viridaestus TaxID=2487322 RepID=A0A3N9TAG0_9VIBR|nr:DUF2065 domain-containing protein [Vibrio viridaestus]RQW61147.1 DUF2065 domain-containing protein [Vibrio viridaestus]
MAHSIWLAFGLLLLVEGIGPFISPRKWRNTILLLVGQTDDNLRRIGGSLVVAGFVICYFYLR